MLVLQSDCSPMPILSGAVSPRCLGGPGRCESESLPQVTLCTLNGSRLPCLADQGEGRFDISGKSECQTMFFVRTVVEHRQDSLNVTVHSYKFGYINFA